MAELHIEIDGNQIAKTVRRALVSEGARIVKDVGIVLPLVLELLRNNELARVLLAEEMFLEAERQARLDFDDPHFENHNAASYDDMVKAAIEKLADTPAGRCEC